MFCYAAAVSTRYALFSAAVPSSSFPTRMLLSRTVSNVVSYKLRSSLARALRVSHSSLWQLARRVRLYSCYRRLKRKVLALVCLLARVTVPPSTATTTSIGKLSSLLFLVAVLTFENFFESFRRPSHSENITYRTHHRRTSLWRRFAASHMALAAVSLKLFPITHTAHIQCRVISSSGHI